MTVRSRDPWRVRVSFHADGDACHATVDGDLTVRSVEVVPGDASAGDGEAPPNGDDTSDD